MSRFESLVSKFSRINSCRNSESGFSTAEWVVIMGFTITLLAGMVQGLYIENLRSTTISTLRDSARVGVRVGDLESVIASPTTADNEAVVSECYQRLVNTMSQVTDVDTSQASCVILSENTAGADTRYFVEARMGDNFDDVSFLPVVGTAFEGRLKNLSARHYSSESAK